MLAYVLILPAGFAAQLIDGTLGMGYGASSSSLLLAAGLAPAAVSASVHVAKVFAGLTSGIAHCALGNVDRQTAVPIAVGGVVGGVGGALFVSSIDGERIRPLVAAILLILGVRILAAHLPRKRTVRWLSYRSSRRFLVPLGLVGGAVDAVGGGGWGPVCTPALLSVGAREPRYVVGSVNAAEFAVALATTIAFAVTLGPSRFLWPIALPLLVGGMIAAPVSALACRKITARGLGVSVGLVLVALNLGALAPVISRLAGHPRPTVAVPPAVFAAIAFGLIALLVRAIWLRRSIGQEA